MSLPIIFTFSPLLNKSSSVHAHNHMGKQFSESCDVTVGMRVCIDNGAHVTVHIYYYYG